MGSWTATNGHVDGAFRMSRHQLVLLLTIVTPVVVGSAPLPKDMKERPSYASTSVGSKWVYRDNDGEFTETVTDTLQKEGSIFVTVVRKRPKELEWSKIVRVSDKGVYEMSIDNRQYDSPLPVIVLPLAVGDEWQSRDEYKEVIIKSVTRVSSFESVEVPAGKFDAVRLQVTIEVMSSLTARKWTETQWYASGIGLLKVDAKERKVELKSFVPGKK